MNSIKASQTSNAIIFSSKIVLAYFILSNFQEFHENKFERLVSSNFHWKISPLKYACWKVSKDAPV